MKCTKCGAECDPRQLFCLRCGTPLNGNKSEEEVIREVEVPIVDIVDAISLDDEDDDIDLIIGRDMSRIREKNNINQNNRQRYDNTYRDKKDVSNEEHVRSAANVQQKPKREQAARTEKEEVNTSGKGKKDDNSGKKKIIIAVAAAIVLLVVIIAVILVTGSSGKFDEYYQNGMNLYEKGKVQASVTQFVKAVDVAKDDNDKKEAYVMLWKAYSQLDGYENEQIEVLNKLISLDSGNESYYEALIVIYQEQDNQEAIDALIESVQDEELKEKLKEFDGTTPVATVAPGEYDKPISVGITAYAGSTIYYTINGGNATTSSDVYTSSIELTEEGKYVIKAIAVDSDGKESRQFEGEYVLDFGTVNPPVVNLDSGTYNERKKIKITADEGCTVYYTTDGSIPTKDSKVYEKAFKIAEKNTIYTFIAIDEKGVSSDVVTRVYDYQRIFAYDYDGAVSGLANVLISKGIMENEFGSYEDGSAMYFEYESMEEIDDDYYYIINATKESEEGITLFSETYAFGCDNGMSYKVKFTGGKYELSEIE